MAERSYNYDPAEVTVFGKDRMRFELATRWLRAALIRLPLPMPRYRRR